MKDGGDGAPIGGEAALAGIVMAVGAGAAAVAWLANALSAYDIELAAGSIVLAGALTAALPAKAGDSFTASFCGLGSVSVRFV